jgi:hypothetical protein
VSAVLTNIQADDQNSTEVHIANPTPFDNRITLELHGTTGEVLDQFQVRLGPKANFSGTVRSMFHNAPLPVAGYIIVRGTQLLSTATLTRVDRALSALIGQPLDPGAADPLKLYAAYFETGGPSRTDIVLVNLAANPVQVVIRAFNLAGAQVGRQVAVTLAARAQYRAELGQALGFNTDAMTTGSLVVDTLAGVLGDVTIRDSEAPVLRRTSFALTGVPSKSMVIPHVISANSLGMTVYAVNTGTSRATATLKVIRPDGAVVQTSTFSIPPAGSASQPVPAGQIGGAILLDSDQPLASLGLVSPGSLLSDIAAIGAQTR